MTLASAAPRSVAARENWSSIAPTDAGFSPDLSARLDAAAAEGRLPNMHGVLIARSGKIALESYFEGADERWGQPVGVVKFGSDDLHDLRSVTKSIVGLLYGIALAEKKVPAPEQSLFSAFPEYPDLAADPQRARLTIAHVLTMTLGTEWNENLPYTNPANSEIAMERASDRYRFILDRPIVGEPGARWIYNGGASALLGRIIAKGVGQSLPAFAEAKLFAPLGVPSFKWASGQDGEPSAASGLRLRPRDLAGIGQLILDGGKRDGRVIVPAEWLEASMRGIVPMGEGQSLRYGYQWYIGDETFNAAPGSQTARVIIANGNGGQRLFVMPDLELVVVTVAGNYNQRGQSLPPLVVLRDVALPGIRT
ncbi:serine hydrolase [Terrarubrum flagellatum]|uniref:serine hydrolase domain-containing protein n=1 Tax=Terrirubrum flagellatum TaxID=2895980 RepID=UPI003144F76C